MPLSYLFHRVTVFIVIVWAGATINFFMPRLAPVNPIRERLLQAVSFGGAGKTDMEAVVAAYEERFGLDQPLWKQYLRYMGDIVRLDCNLRINRVESIACRVEFWPTNIRGAMNHLTLKIAVINDVKVNDSNAANSGGAEIHRYRRT